MEQDHVSRMGANAWRRWSWRSLLSLAGGLEIDLLLSGFFWWSKSPCMFYLFLPFMGSLGLRAHLCIERLCTSFIDVEAGTCFYYLKNKITYVLRLPKIHVKWKFRTVVDYNWILILILNTKELFSNMSQKQLRFAFRSRKKSMLLAFHWTL